ncbi:alpha/beta hydrolase family protein [mine drainage metagenome]|uniref:Alpha/beta hydrolase family protein n=1 Tax=mine drainage metagenome TaxID=410659 RepID=A0A1J5QUC1_9ZZZZ
MTPALLFVHGWGFDAGFWQPLRQRLAGIPSVAWDLGFHGAPARPLPPGDAPLVAVGHSFGLLWLLKERPLPWRSLVSINGFSRFTRADDFPQGVAPRLLDRMAARLDQAPAAVYQDFMARCGMDVTATGGMESAATGGLDSARLAWGLSALANWDCRAAPPVDLALCGRQDPILPTAMSEALFAPALAKWRDGGHLLPLTDPDWCARQLTAHLESLT